MTSDRIVHVIVYDTIFPGGGRAPDVDEYMTEERALQEYGLPDSKVADEWQYF